MQQAISQTTWPPSTTSTSGSTVSSSDTSSAVTKLVSENAVIVFGRRGCCMCHVVKQLLIGLGVNPTVFDVDAEDEAAVIADLSKIVAFDGDDRDETGRPVEVVQLPAVFVGGKKFGGLERVMATHITGELVPILREARALWL